MGKGAKVSAQDRMRALCRQVTVAHDLDPEIQEELYGHMEDKFLAYLSGEEKVSEEDAFILVREHFGDPAVLKEILQDVHDRSVYASLARRIAAALVSTVAITVLVNLVDKATMFGLALWTARHRNFEPLAVFQFSLEFVSRWAIAGLLCLVLVKWQRQLAIGRRPWFVRWSARRMLTAIGLALVFPLLIPSMSVRLLEGSQVFAALGYIPIALTIAAAAGFVAEGCAWLWWSDRRPRAVRGLGWALLSWILLQEFFQLFPRLVPMVVLSEGAPAFFGHVVEPLAQGPVAGSSLQWSLVWRESTLWTTVISQHETPYVLLAKLAALSVSLVVLAAVLAWAVYRSAHFVSSRFALRRIRRSYAA